MAVPARHFANGHSLEPPFPAGTEQAVFAMGCFWGAERLFWEIDGVYSTAAGYIAASMVLGLAAVWVGRAAAKAAGI